MIGTNDLGYGGSVNLTFHNFTKIVSALKSANIEVFIQFTIECNKVSCGDRLGRIRELNRRLRAYAKSEKLTYIDLNDGLTSTDEGLLSKYTYDGLHLRANGYIKWSQAIFPYFSIPN